MTLLFLGKRYSVQLYEASETATATACASRTGTWPSAARSIGTMTPGVVAETDLAGTPKSEYVFFDGERVARRDGPTAQAVSSITSLTI